MTEKDEEPRDADHQVLAPEPLEDEQRLARRTLLAECREALKPLPSDDLHEIPGRPGVVFAVKDYSKPDTLRELSGKEAARKDAPFLFRAFETGQPRPPQPGSKRAAAPRAFTIHEYLDWTVTAPDPVTLDDLDFGGFRVVVLYPRYLSLWPAPGAVEADVAAAAAEDERLAKAGGAAAAPLRHRRLACSRPAMPVLQTHATPICAATIRAGPGFLEVPFYATHESKRNKGYGRALLEAIEAICRATGIPTILLCSTDDPKTRGTWQQLGFQVSSQSQLDALGVTHMDLLHMDNTVQMHKEVPPQRPWHSLCIKHEAYRQRVYYLPGYQVPDPVPLPLSSAFPSKPSKPTKKRPKKRI
ncbi:hypothetical protein ACKKBG_A08095 [Auxenochlorella protothecoides x Auxenochlorella symbiontica]|uniref:N-acetyltransferase domain-containing protein n=2 Tax=Auxenochlorella protothecoides TaxID=3075 RepID=A0A087SSK4_AUXPR|nr:hypothetical protein F751_3538 [Auxenochlorella protothecoides]KFM28708.1 hypothetical protein F751_3538 [Auxenochlorella protothecoides]